jgi:hypothetical protein
MMLKKLYLSGHPVVKDDFRALLIEGEKRIASGVVSGMTRATRALLECFPVERWRTARKANFESFVAALGEVPGVRVLLPEGDGCVPFNAVVVVETPDLRDALRAKLISKHIYPAVLWSLEEPVLKNDIPAKHIELSRCILNLHCDMRYGKNDMVRVAQVVIEGIG